jgi:hypothetical protein
MKKFLIASALALAASASMAGNTDIGGLTYNNSQVTSNGSFYTMLAAGTYTFTFNLGTTGKTKLDAAWLSLSGDKFADNGNDIHSFAFTPGSTSASGSFTQYFATATKVFFNVNSTKASKVGYSVDYTIAPVPEPETYAMFLAGLGALGLLARRRKPL